MITIERTSVMNFENAIRGARNPMNSWNRMDSFYDEQGNFIMGQPYTRGRSVVMPLSICSHAAPMSVRGLLSTICRSGSDVRKWNTAI